MFICVNYVKCKLREIDGNTTNESAKDGGKSRQVSSYVDERRN